MVAAAMDAVAIGMMEGCAASNADDAEFWDAKV